jgi:hypothetical protein
MTDDRDHERSDAEDRPLELDEPKQPDGPVDDEDRDVALRERRDFSYPDEEQIDRDGDVIE